MSAVFDAQLAKLEDGSIDPDEVQSLDVLTIIEKQALLDGIAQKASDGGDLDILTT